jgi:hypothetical protein
MRCPAHVSTAVFIIAGILIVVGANSFSSSEAEASEPELVPEPTVTEVHEFNRSEGGGDFVRVISEGWRIGIDHGGVSILLGVANYTDDFTDARESETNVAYSQNINFMIDGKLYIAMFTFDRVVFKIGGQEVVALLKDCDGFNVTHTPVEYDGTNPTLECNMTFEAIRVYSDIPNSTFDLTLAHHFRGDWNQTSIKVEALFDLSNAEFYNGTEFNAGEPFTVEIRYVMVLTDPELAGDNAVMPSGFTNTTLEYNLTLDNGSPYTLSKLEMRDGFTIYNASGAQSAMGYSTMEMADPTVADLEMYNPKSAVVTHGFPNLTYLDTTSVKSDPELTVYHDRVTAGSTTDSYYLLVPVLAVVAAVIAAIIVVARKRSKGQQGDAGERLKKP